MKTITRGSISNIVYGDAKLFGIKFTQSLVNKIDQLSKLCTQNSLEFVAVKVEADWLEPGVSTSNKMLVVTPTEVFCETEVVDSSNTTTCKIAKNTELYDWEFMKS